MSSDLIESKMIQPILLILVTIFVVFAGYEWLEITWLDNLSPEVLYGLHIARGVGTALLVGFIVVWYFLSGEPFTEKEKPPSSDSDRRRDRLNVYTRWFIHLRWLAVLAVFGTLILVQTYQLLPRDSVFRLATQMAGLGLSNLIYRYWHRVRSNYQIQLVVQMITDLLFLTLLLHCSGGLENPLFLLYVFHVILASILFSPRITWCFTGLASGLLMTLGLAEYMGFVPHATLTLFPHKVAEEGLHHASQNFWFVMGRMGSFVGVLVFTTFFVTMLMEQLRRREDDLLESMREARANRNRLEGIVQAAGLGIVLLNQDCQVEWYNSKMEEWFGWTRDITGSSCPFEIETDAGDRKCLANQTLTNNEVTRHEISMPTQSGDERTFYIITSPITNESGEAVEAVQILQDITKRKLLEAEMSHAGKMKLLGRLASGIAHEIGNPLNSIKTRLHRMRRSEDPQFVKDNLDFLEDQLNRVAEIVHGISQFSQQHTTEWELLDLNTILRETVDVIKLDQSAEKLDIDMNLASDLPATAGVYNQLEQVCLNLLVNAKDAVGNDGVIQVSTFSEHRDLHVVVEDSGPGIPEENRDSIFDAFYTTKDDGTGLGLSISQSIVHAHGGSISVTESELGGALFRVKIPLRSEVAPPMEKGHLTHSPVGTLEGTAHGESNSGGDQR